MMCVKTQVALQGKGTYLSVLQGPHKIIACHQKRAICRNRGMPRKNHLQEPRTGAGIPLKRRAIHDPQGRVGFCCHRSTSGTVV
jgi:hypothetical protein